MKRIGGTLDVIIAEDRDLARGARRRRHPLGVGERRRHRLFAPDMLARFERRDRHRRMQRVRRRDRDDVDSRVGDQRPPVGGRGLEAELVGAPPREPFLDLAQHDAPNDRPCRRTPPERPSRPARGTCPCSPCRSVRRRSCPCRFALRLRAPAARAPRQYKYFICYTNWNICSTNVRAAAPGRTKVKDERQLDDRTAGELRRARAPADRDRASSAQAPSAGRGLRARPSRRVRARHRLGAGPQRRGSGLDAGALRPDARLCRLLRAPGDIPLAPAQSLAGLFGTSQGAAAERPRQRRSDPSPHWICRFRGRLDRPAA